MYLLTKVMRKLFLVSSGLRFCQFLDISLHHPAFPLFYKAQAGDVLVYNKNNILEDTSEICSIRKA